MIPLAYKMRPQLLKDIVGQSHLVGPQGAIFKMIKNNKLTSLILYGNPGVGKTTLAIAICNELSLSYKTFNASSDNKALLKNFIEEASKFSSFVLIVDEIHRMKKDIQDYLLEFLESGKIILIGLTTINPYRAVNPAIRSRALVFKMYDLSNDDLSLIIERSLAYFTKPLTITSDAKNYLIQAANGDVRYLINNLEGIVNILDNNIIDLEIAKTIVQKTVISYSKNEDQYYDTLSGLQKSIRGSDVDASLHYLAKLLLVEDLIPLLRRLYVIAYEDIGLANPNIGPKVKAVGDIVLELGLPEARIPLSVLVIEMALSPKSNTALIAIDAAMKDIEEGLSGNLPAYLKNTYAFDPKQKPYLYPHDFPGSWVNQQYLPDKIKDASYYHPKDESKYEQALKERYDAIKQAKNNDK